MAKHWRGCEIPICVVILNVTGQALSNQMRFWSWHCFNWGLGPGEVQSSLPTEIILAFSDRASNPNSINNYYKVYLKSINEAAQIGVAFAIYVYDPCHLTDLKTSTYHFMSLLQWREYLTCHL